MTSKLIDADVEQMTAEARKNASAIQRTLFKDVKTFDAKQFVDGVVGDVQ